MMLLLRCKLSISQLAQFWRKWALVSLGWKLRKEVFGVPYGTIVELFHSHHQNSLRQRVP
jgi:hypothetical protein